MTGPRHLKISDHQQSWGYEDSPWKGPGPPLLGAADCQGGTMRSRGRLFNNENMKTLKRKSNRQFPTNIDAELVYLFPNRNTADA